MRFPTRTFVACLLAAGAAACTDTRTISTPIPPGMHAGRIELNPVFTPAAKTISAALGDFGITFDHVRIVIRNNPDTNSVVADTTVVFGPTSNSLTLDLTVPVDADGQVFNALVQYTGPSGVVFSGTILVQSHAPDAPAPEGQTLTLSFVGPGAKLKSINVSPKPVKLVASQTIPLTITATDSSGASIAVPPLVFASSDESVAKVVSTGSTRSVQSLGKRGQASIIATTPTGISDTVSAIVTLPAAAVVVVSGGSQTGPVGTPLSQPVVVQVNAADGIGVPDVSVIFAAPTGGAVGSATTTTDANGRASTTFTLATAAGGQLFSVSAGSLPALSVDETAKPGPASAATSTLSTNSAQINADNQTPSTTTVSTKDQYGNVIGTGGATVTFTTTLGHWGAGTTATTVTATDKGDGTYSATLFSAQSGVATITGTIGGTAIATPPVTVTAIATILDHFDVTLANGSPITGNQSAGIPIAVRIRALDASGNVVAAYNSQTILSITNSTLPDGNPTVIAPTAVGGVINTSVRFGRPGSNVRLVATGSTKTGQSDPFTVVAGPPSLIGQSDSTIIYGMGQTPTQYPSFYITDGAGNITGRQTAAFTVTAPCTLSASQYTSDVEGVISFNASTLTIPTVGADFPFSCQLSANGAAFTAPTARVALVAQAALMTAWTGHTDAVWETRDNWTADTPSSSSTAFIAAAQPRATPRYPVLQSTDPFIRSIDVENGARLDLGGHTLNVAGNIDSRISGAITNGVIAGFTTQGFGSMRGTLPNVNVQSGAYSLTGVTTITGSLAVNGGSIDPGSQPLSVVQNFATSGSGTLSMTASPSILHVTGTTTFKGGSEAGLLTNGSLVAEGDFVQQGTNTFTPSGTHIVSLPIGQTAQNQSVTFADVTNSWFQNLSIALASGRTVTINSAVKILGSLSVGSSGGGTMSLPAGLFNQRNGPIATNGTMTVNLGGVVNTAGITFNAGTVTLTGNGSLALGNGTLALGSNLHLTINVTGNVFGSPPAGCTRGSNVVIDGTNTAAIAAINAACGGGP